MVTRNLFHIDLPSMGSFFLFLLPYIESQLQAEFHIRWQKVSIFR